MKKTYRLAELNIEIDSLYEEVHRLCASYGTSAVPDFPVRTAPEDIPYERERSRRERAAAGLPEIEAGDGTLETLAVYRKIAEKLPAYSGFLMHGSCVAVDGEGYLFIASSGTGKSTHTRLWREYLGDRAVMINDDKPLVRLTDGHAVIYGTPWDGKHHLSTNTAVPLKAVCILTRAGQNTIHRIGAREAYPMLLQQIYRPASREALAQTLSLADRLPSLVSLWKLGCNMEIGAAKTAYETMKGLRI